jgi:hypothetical protein
MRRIMMTIGGTVLVLGSSFAAHAQDKGPGQAPKQAPMQAPMQAPKQAPMQAPQQKIAPMQAPAQAPHKHVQAPTQSPIQKGKMAFDEPVTVEGPSYAMSRPGLFRRFR